MSIDFHRLMEPINNNRLIFIDYIDYIDCFPMIDFHRLNRPGSLERVLQWLKPVRKNEEQLQMLGQCGTVEFLASEQVFSNPESAAFFLRLFGFLASREEVFNSLQCVKGGEFLSRFLDKPRNEPELWNEGIVRNGYFQALISLIEQRWHAVVEKYMYR